jgi:DNA-binding response OmpR family regulator
MALELGAARCLRKPFAPASLLMLTNECLANDQPRFGNATQARQPRVYPPRHLPAAILHLKQQRAFEHRQTLEPAQLRDDAIHADRDNARAGK